MPKINTKIISIQAGEEVVPKRRRRTFGAQEKLRIIKEIDASKHGEAGAILRREGVYASTISVWRRGFHERGMEGLAPNKPGRKGLDGKDIKIQALEMRVAALQRDLELSRTVVEFQKKVSGLLEISLPSVERSS